jgi:hypothetical protein
MPPIYLVRPIAIDVCDCPYNSSDLMIFAGVELVTEKQPEQREDYIDGLIDDTDEFIDVCVGISQWTARNGRFILEEDYRVGGEVWRVHKSDPDDRPSKPHAHCVAGQDRFIGCKLHLGTGELYKRNKPLDRFLCAKQFGRLIELIRPKFPELKLPLGC